MSLLSIDVTSGSPSFSVIVLLLARAMLLECCWMSRWALKSSPWYLFFRRCYIVVVVIFFFFSRFVANLLKDYAGDTGGGGARGKRRGAPTAPSQR